MEKLFLHKLHHQLGAKFKKLNTRQIPQQYQNAKSELHAVYNNIALIDRSYLGKLKLSGKDTLDLLNRISTNDMQYLNIGTVCDTVFTTPKGRIVDFCRVINCGNELLLICSFLKTNRLIDWINRFIILEDANVKDATADFIWLTLLGPHCRQFLNQYSSIPISGDEDAIWLKFEDFSFPALRNTNFVIPAYNFCFDRSIAETIFNSFTHTLGQMGGTLIGDDAFQAIRIESGMPEMEAELSHDYNPHEARLLNAVSFTKGCYTGQEIIARLDTYDKVQKYLMIIESSKRIRKTPPFDIVIDDEQIGTMTSIAHNPLTRLSMGLGYVKKLYTTENNIYVEIRVNNQRIPGRLLKPPQAYQS